MKIKRLHTLRDSCKGFEIEWCFFWSTKFNHADNGLPDTGGKEWERARAASSYEKFWLRHSERLQLKSSPLFIFHDPGQRTTCRASTSIPGKWGWQPPLRLGVRLEKETATNPWQGLRVGQLLCTGHRAVHLTLTFVISQWPCLTALLSLLPLRKWIPREAVGLFSALDSSS